MKRNCNSPSKEIDFRTQEEEESWNRISFLRQVSKEEESKERAVAEFCRIGHFSNGVFISTKFSWNYLQAGHVLDITTATNGSILKQNPFFEHERSEIRPNICDQKVLMQRQ